MSSVKSTKLIVISSMLILHEQNFAGFDYFISELPQYKITEELKMSVLVGVNRCSFNERIIVMYL